MPRLWEVSNSGLTVVAESQEDGEALLSRLAAAGITSGVDFAAKLDAAYEGLQAAATFAAAAPHLKVIARALYLRARFGTFRLR